jgi:nucleotide-binding universal stress UspA family protein
MYERILLPLDGSKLAEAALPHAVHLAKQFGCELVLLRVAVSPYAIVAPDLVLAGTDPDLRELWAHATQYLKGIADRLQEQGLHVRTEVCEGPVAETILEHVVALNVDLIVMSTHGRGGVLRWVYGSVAERVLQGSACPVLLIRSKERSNP